MATQPRARDRTGPSAFCRGRVARTQWAFNFRTIDSSSPACFRKYLLLNLVAQVDDLPLMPDTILHLASPIVLSSLRPYRTPSNAERHCGTRIIDIYLVLHM